MEFPYRAAACPFDPDHPSTVSDPYPGYQWLREHAPVRYLKDHDLWVVANYSAAVEVLNNPQRFSSQLGMGAVHHLHAPQSVDYRIGAPGVRVLIATDPPEHTRLRKAVTAPFRRSAVIKLIPRIEQIAGELTAGLLANAEKGEADIYRDLAAPLPELVLADLLGVPPRMRGEFREWASVITDDLDRSGATDTRLGRGYDMFRYFYSEIHRRKREPSDDLFSIIAATDEAGLSDHEVMAFCAFLLVAGVETTTSLFTNIIDMLIHQPQVRQRLWADPGLADPVVEESLRFDTSVQGLWRATVTQDELSGVTLPADARLLILFGSANRDEEVFDNAGNFNLERTANPHLAFGYGHHRCLGALLAREELVAALKALVKATGGIAPRGQFTRRNSLVLRGHTAQPVMVWPR
jgi:hypothetical protein